MKIIVRIVAFDLDGPVAQDFGLSKFWFIRILANYFLLFLPLGKWLYLKRKPNQKVISWMEKRRQRGNRVIIVSDTLNTHQRLVEKWLKENKVPYDHLLLRFPFSESPKISSHWHILVDDNARPFPNLQEAIKKRKLGPFFAFSQREL